jgi:ribosomal protein L40E
MGKTKIASAFNRTFNRVYICMRCNAKIRADTQKVIKKQIKCRKCGYGALRQKSKERKV